MDLRNNLHYVLETRLLFLDRNGEVVVCLAYVGRSRPWMMHPQLDAMVLSQLTAEVCNQGFRSSSRNPYGGG